jgi:class 3 adenylate cyclase/WD40 repeat protein
VATTTFLFVDQVGSTEQLTRLGDTTAQQVRRALFDLLRQSTQVHGGREIDFTGDGLFCSFESAADAVGAAVEMQQAVTAFGHRRPTAESLAIKIGLNTGEPLESEGGGHFGSAVVVASRLCSRAESGQILASALVRALVEPRGRHRFALVGSLDLKGIPQPVETFAVEWTPDDRRAYLPAQLAAARTGPFVGRAREVDAVLAAWKRISAGGRQLVLISGDSGMGVTRLAAEAAEGLRAAGASLWAGAAQGTDERLAAWAEAVESWAGSVSMAELRQAVGDSAADLVRLLPGLARLLPNTRQPGSLDAQAATFLIADAVDAVAERWSAVEPLVIVLDRLHEADAASLTVLRRLLHSHRGGRILVIGCYEPSSVGASRVLRALEDVRDAVDIRLEGLAEPDVRRLIGDTTGEPASDEGVRAVVAESEGSPYYVLQMARSMHQQGITRRVEEAVGRAVELRSDLRLQREEISLGLRQLDELREEMSTSVVPRIDPDGTPPVPGVCPYRGLLAYTAEDADTFFGRDALVAEMVAALSVSRWLAVVGPSGSGKSSAVRAGLHPALTRGALPGSAGWVLVDVRPGAHPLDALGEALAGLAGADGPELSREIASGPLADVVRRLFGRRRLVMHVDQFEELWTSAPHDTRTRVLDLLVEAVAAPDEAVSVVVTMRADYYGRTAEHGALAARMAESQVLVPPMTPAELRAAVELPGRQAGLVLEPGLAQAVVDDVAHEPGTLPLLSTAMAETWERRRGRSLTLTAYAETGGARRAIAHLADATLDSLDPAQQEVARRLLMRLAAPARDGSDVARPAPLSELLVDEDTRQVLDRLVDRRLVTAGATTAQVAHEALLREWPRLRAWLDADRDGRRLHQQIATAADEWESSGRDDDVLLRGARLAAADEWRIEHAVELSAREREFLDASVGLRERDLRRARRTTRRFQALAAVLVLLLAGAGVATYLAVKSSRTAAERANEAIARDLANQAGDLPGDRLDTALLLAVEGYRRHASVETREGLLTTLGHAAPYLTGFRPEVSGDVVASAITRDGRSLVVLTADGDLMSFDTTNWSADPVTLAREINSPGSVDVTPDGAMVLYTAQDGLHVLDADGDASGSLIRMGRGTSAEFSLDGKFVNLVRWISLPGTVGAGYTLRAEILDSRSGAVIHQFRADDATFVLVRPHADELLLVRSNGDGTETKAQRLGLDGALLAELVYPAPGGISNGTYTRDGKHLLTSAFDGSVTLRDADTLEPVGEALAPDVPTDGGFRIPTWFRMSPSGGRLAIGYQDGSVAVLEVGQDRSLRIESRTEPLPGGDAFPNWLDDDRFLVMTDSTAAEYDTRNVTSLAERVTGRIPEAPIQALAVSPDGDHVLYLAGGHVRDMSVSGDGGTLDADVPIAPSVPADLMVSPNGSQAVVVGRAPDPGKTAPDGILHTVAVVPLRSAGDPVIHEFRTSSALRAVALSPDGETVAVSDGVNVTQLEVDTGLAVAAPISVPGLAFALLYSSDGRLLFIGDGLGQLLSVNRRTGAMPVPQVFFPGVAIVGMAAMPERDELLIASSNGRILVVESRTGSPVADGTLDLGSSSIAGLTVSPDGSHVAVVDDDGLFRLWDMGRGKQVGPPLQPGIDTSQVSYVSAGKALITVSSGNLMSWDLDPKSWQATACELVGRELSRQEWDTYLSGEPYRATCSTG